MTEPPGVASALADLALAAGDQPLALTGIEERARRVRVRRGAGRAAIVAVCCGGLVAGIAVAGAGDPQRSQISSLAPAPVVLARCTTLSAQASSGALAKGAADRSSASPKTSTGVVGGAEAAAGRPEVGALLKAPGTVTGAPTRSAVTILVAAPLYPKPQPVTFAITGQTAFLSVGEPIDATILRVGSHVGFVATRTGPDSFRLELIETNPDLAGSADSRRPKTTAGPLGAASRPNGSAAASAKPPDGSEPPPVGGTVQGKGGVAAVSSSAASLAVKGGPLAGQTLSLTVTPATQFAADGQQCDPTGLPAGTPMSFTATRAGPATYRLDQLNI